MTTITIQFDRPRSSRLAVLAMGLGVSLVMWAEQRSRAGLSRDEHSRRRAVAAGIRDREHAALRTLQLR